MTRGHVVMRSTSPKCHRGEVSDSDDNTVVHINTVVRIYVW
jgi:hypothetical protein